MPATAHRARKGWLFLGLALGLGALLGIIHLERKNNASTLQVAHELLSLHPQLTANGRVATLKGTDRGLGDTVRNYRFTAVAMTSFWIYVSREASLGRIGSYGVTLELKRDPSDQKTWILSRHLGINFLGTKSWSFGWEIDRISAPKS